MKVLVLMLAFCASTAFSIQKSYVDRMFTKVSKQIQVPEPLLRAICYSESRHNPSAFVYGDGGGSNHAFGICQVLRTTALNFIRVDESCKEDFRNKLKNHKTCNLFGPYTNMLAAAKYLKYQLKRYNNSWTNAIAAYNSGSLRTCPKKGYIKTKVGYIIRCTQGGLVNQYYVDRVLHALSRI